MLCVYSHYDFEEWVAMKKLLLHRFKVKELGAVKWLLGMNITRDREACTTTIDSERYIEKVLEKYGMTDCNPTSTPEEKSKLSKEQCPSTEEEKKEMESIPFRSAVGSIAYASLSTRPDITHAVNEISQFLNNPGKQHWAAVKRILRYLRGTKSKP